MTQLAKNAFFPMIYHVYNEIDSCFTKENRYMPIHYIISQPWQMTLTLIRY